MVSNCGFLWNAALPLLSLRAVGTVVSTWSPSGIAWAMSMLWLQSQLGSGINHIMTGNRHCCSIVCDGKFCLFLSSTWQQLGRVGQLCDGFSWVFLSLHGCCWEAALAGLEKATVDLCYSWTILGQCIALFMVTTLSQQWQSSCSFWISRCLYSIVALPRWFCNTSLGRDLGINAVWIGCKSGKEKEYRG